MNFPYNAEIREYSAYYIRAIKIFKEKSRPKRVGSQRNSSCRISPIRG